MIGRILEITFSLVLVYLILTNADSFARVTSAVSEAYTSAVRTLQGRS